jgi:hypothetical protein
MFEFMESFRRRKLDPASGIKPLDFGAGGITGSVNPDGRLVAVNAYHPVYGYVTLTGTPPFPEEQRYNPQAVRAYRRALADQDGFGLRFEALIVGREAWLIEDAIPQVRLALGSGASADVITFVPEGEGSDDPPVGVVQVWRFSSPEVQARLAGVLSLQRCAYTQLTEGGPAAMPPVEARVVTRRGGVAVIENPALGWAVAVPDQGTAILSDGRVAWRRREEAGRAGGESETLIVGLGATPDDALTHFRRLWDAGSQHLLEATLDVWRQRWQGWEAPDDGLDLPRRRGLVYGLACSIPTREDAACLLTDHLLLPLSWNRDAYFIARALLDWGEDGASAVRRHLAWLFDAAERPEGLWGRSYFANGQIKDRGFQLDQQLYPLLELAEYTLARDDRAMLTRFQGQIWPVLDALLARKAPDAWLFPTDETPADDPIPNPYHLSSHILLWRMLTRLDALKLDHPRAGTLASLAEDVRAAVRSRFAVGDGQDRLYAYAIDGAGGSHLYHDANDLPLALAPAWGFCPADDPVWRATLDFAFSEANAGGYYAGRLGSVHTPAPWPLGDLQDLIVARALDDTAREDAARTRLIQAAQWDGALPEAVNAETGAVVSRHWFAWPNAVVALVANSS